MEPQLEQRAGFDGFEWASFRTDNSLFLQFGQTFFIALMSCFNDEVRSSGFGDERQHFLPRSPVTTFCYTFFQHSKSCNAFCLKLFRIQCYLQLHHIRSRDYQSGLDHCFRH